MENLNKYVDLQCKLLENSTKEFKDIFYGMFSNGDRILGEWNDGYKIYTITYREAKEKIFDFAYSFNELYPNVKDCYIALAMESTIEWIIAFWGIIASGNKPYLVNLRHPKAFVNSLLKSLDITYIVGQEDLGYVGELIVCSTLTHTHTKEFIPTFSNEMALSTSATTLKEKIIFYTGLELSSQILNVRDVLKKQKLPKKHYKGRLKLLVFLPLYHIFGFMATYLWFSYFGRTLVFLKDYSSNTILRTVRKHEVTHIFAVPLFWNTVEKELMRKVRELHMEKKLNKGIQASIRLQTIFPIKGIGMSKKLMHRITDELFGKSVVFCISGGSYIKTETLRLFNGIGYPLFNGYGMSEIGITSFEMGKIKDRLKNSVGKPLSSVAYEIRDNELYVKGTSISHKMKIDGEYVCNTDYYKTMDLARIDKDGRCYILGRKDDLYIGPNGENINPDQIEQLFDLKKIERFSILPIENKLSIVVEISEYMSLEERIKLYDSIMKQNAMLDSSLRVEKIYFTYNKIMADTAIKVSRQYLNKKLENKEVVLHTFEEIQKDMDNSSVNPKILDKVLAAIKDCLGKDEIKPSDNFFFDLGGNSLEYFSLISSLNTTFGITISFENGVNYHTAMDLAKEVERLLSL